MSMFLPPHTSWELDCILKLSPTTAGVSNMGMLPDSSCRGLHPFHLYRPDMTGGWLGLTTYIIAVF